MNAPRMMAGHVLGDRYTLLTPVAKGGMGEVWKARDRVTGQLVAAKVLRPELSGEELSLSRLRLEARNAMSVQHPNIAAVLDSGEEEGRGWIVMELVDGRPLTDFLRGGQRIAVEDLLPVLMQVAMALGAAASAGIVHRDIKPANVLVRPDGMVKLTDFGISRADGQVDLTAAGMVMGTAQYLPPEQAMGEPATSSGDLYALGVIAYEAVAGRRPFTGASQVDIAFSHVNDPVPPLPADVPGPFADVVLHLLEKTPQRRPASGLDLVRELAAAARALGLPVSPHPLPAPEGEGVSAPTSPQPVVPPVTHTTRRHLPDDLLAAPSFPDTERPASASSAEARPASEASGASGGASFSSASPDVRRHELTERLRARAAARAREDADALSRGERRSAEEPSRPASTPASHAGVSAGAEGTRSAGDRASGGVTRARPASAAPASSRSSRSAAGTGPAWASLTRENAARGAQGLPPARTAYNRSRVAAQESDRPRVGRWVAFVLVLVMIVLAVAVVVHTTIGAFSPAGAADRTTSHQEVRTWVNPLPTV